MGTKWFSICLRSAAAICLCAAFLIAQGVVTKDQNAKETMDASLKALGGADKIDGIKSLIIRGTGTLNHTVSSPSADAGASTGYEFEIRMLLPDNFIQIVQYPESFVQTTRYERTMYNGISRETLLTPPRIFVRPGLDIPVPTQYPAGMEKLMFARAAAEWSSFLIGTLVKTGPAPLALSSRSTPGVFNMDGGASGEIEFDLKTGYPSVIRYGLIGGGGESVEMRFLDRFPVNGIMFPRVIVVTNAVTKTERRIEEALINPKLSLKDFEVPKK